MNVTGKFLLAFLCISIASYGLSGSVNASSHNLLPFTIATNSDSYSTGDMILIFGSIRDYDGTSPIVTIQIFGPLGGMKVIDQVTPNSDGTFEIDLVAQGTINLTGEYIVKAMWNKQPIETTFEYVGGDGGGCLIATAAFGSELSPQVQFLREIRDNTVLQTESGSVFMAGFNQFYYSFSPAIADYERENPTFKEAVKLTLTPLLTSLTLLHYADIDSESEMLGYGIGVILLNIGMYFVAPAVLIMTVRKRI